MNLEESDKFLDSVKSRERSKKILMFAILFIAFIIIVLVCMIAYVKNADAHTEKIFVDGVQLSSFKGLYVVQDDGNIYFDIKQLAEDFGYTYTIGNYEGENESLTEGYFSTSFETVVFSQDSDTYRKYVSVDSENTLNDMTVTTELDIDNYEVFTLLKPIITIDDKLYVSGDDVEKMFNMQVAQWDTYRKKIRSFSILLSMMLPNVPENYTVDTKYENLRSILDGQVVVKVEGATDESYLYGIYDLNTGKESLSVKYSNVSYIQSKNNYYVTSTAERVGLLTKTDDELNFAIRPDEYSSLKLVDYKNNFYEMTDKSSGNVGIINGNGEVIINADFDSVGYDLSKFQNEKFNSKYIFNDTVIPVCYHAKGGYYYGLYGIDGEELLSTNYDSFGYAAGSAIRSSVQDENILLVRKEDVGINGIIFCQNDTYGIYDTDRLQMALPAVFTKIYAKTKNNKTEYYVQETRGSETTDTLLSTYVNNYLETVEDKEEPVEEVEEQDIQDDGQQELIEEENVETNEELESVEEPESVEE